MANDTRLRFTAGDDASKVIERLKSNLGGLGKQADDLKGVFGALGGAAAIGALSKIAGMALDAGKQMAVLSEKTGIAVSDLSALKFAAQQSDTEFESLANGMKKLAVNAAAAAKGGAEQAQAFGEVGVSVVDTGGKMRGVEDILGDVADAFAMMPDGVEKTALAVKLFGKSGEDLIPFLNQGRKGFAELRQETERLGLVMDDAFAKKARQAGDEIDKLQAVAGMAAMRIGGGMVPALRDIAAAFATAGKSGQEFTDFGRGIGELLRVIATGAAGVAAFVRSIGTDIGALAAIAVSVGQGNLKGAVEIWKARNEDIEHIALAAAATMDGINRQSTEDVKATNTKRVTEEQSFGELLRQVKGQELDNLKAIMTSQVEAYKDADQELAKVRAKRLAAEEQAAQFMAKLTTPTRVTGETPTNLDVAENIVKARALIAQGGKDELGLQRTDQALEQLKQARELLLQMRAAGVSQDFLTSQARDIAEAERAAIAAQEADAQARRETINQFFDGILAKAQALTRLKIDFDKDAAVNSAAQMRALLDQALAATPIVVPVVPMPTSADQLGKLIAGGTASTAPGTWGTDAQGKYYNLDTLPQRARGGAIRGPGGPTADRVLLWGSSGEYVMRAAAVRHYGAGVMAALNTLQLPRFAAGGPVIPSLRSGAGSGSAGQPINLSWPGGGPFRVTAAPDVAGQMVSLFQRESLKCGRRG